MSKILQPLAVAGNDLIILAGSFLPNGGSQPVTTGFTNSQEFFSITRTGAGAFLIKFVESYAQLVSKWADISLTGVLDLKPQWGAYTAATWAPFVNAQIVLNILAVATPTDIAANAANRVSFGFIFRRTSVQT